MKCITTTHRRLSWPWVSGWYFQAGEAPVQRISPCNEGHLARRPKYGLRMVGVLTGLGVGVRQQLFWAPLTTGEHTSHTRSHLCTQCSLGQQASEKECIQIIKLFFPYVKNRPATGNVRPGIQACHLAIYHGACLHTIKCLSLDGFQRGRRRATKGPIIVNHSSPWRWR